MKSMWCWMMLLSLAQLIACTTEPPPPCFSDVYCHGPLLHTVQMAKIYADSKTFVDMKMKAPPNETVKLFLKFMENHDHQPDATLVKAFVEENFEQADNEWAHWEPKDWVETPKYLDRIENENLRKWGSKLNHIWKDLGRQIKDEVRKEEELYSIIWVPNPVIVPGGRFREFYYWDSYWIIQGLLISEMFGTVRGMLENFIFIVNKFGHVPNGGRIYYLERSQPPLLIPMVKLYVDATNDFEFIAENVQALEYEFSYWMSNHTRVIEVDGKNYTLAVYGDKSRGPRPESYSEDIDNARAFKEEDKETFYSELKAAAESGWDFSSRWFITNSTNKGNLTNTKTRSIAPVELNSILYWNAVILQEFYEKLGDLKKVDYYKNIANSWLDAVTTILWHEEVGAWLDYDIQNSVKRDYFYPTNIAPLWTGCYPKENKDAVVELVLKYLRNSHVYLYTAGIPSTVEHTGEQWDYPNAWPPLQHMMIVGLNNTGHVHAQRLAFELARNWIEANYKTYNETERMFEKYDIIGGYGTGGEYEVQLGFGWTNGVILYLLDHYANEINKTNNQDQPVVMKLVQSSPSAPNAFVQVTTAIVGVVISLVVGYIGMSIYKRRAGSQTTKKIKEQPSRAQYTELRNMPRNSRNTR